MLPAPSAACEPAISSSIASRTKTSSLHRHFDQTVSDKEAVNQLGCRRVESDVFAVVSGFGRKDFILSLGAQTPLTIIFDLRRF